MNKYSFTFLLAIVLFCFSCEKQEILQFHSSAGVYFFNQYSTYSFLENYANREIGSDTLNIPVSIWGDSVDYDRAIAVEVVKDSLFTADDRMFEILPSYVGANKFNGFVSVIIRYSEELDDSIYVARLRIIPNAYFEDASLTYAVYSVNITNKITMPENWGRLKVKFGNYSNSWYSFILSTTGLSSIPYWTPRGSKDPKNPDPEKYWMTSAQMYSYAAQVKVALQEYNDAHPGSPLLHLDGEFKGKPVTMP